MPHLPLRPVSDKSACLTDFGSSWSMFQLSRPAWSRRADDLGSQPVSEEEFRFGSAGMADVCGSAPPGEQAMTVTEWPLITSSLARRGAGR